VAEIARLFPDNDLQSPLDERQAEALREATRIAEALIFVSSEPVDEKDIGKRMPEGVTALAALEALRAQYAGRGINLIRVNTRWTFRTASDLSWLLSREVSEPKKLSRPAIETLSIIAYHQPVTRAEIEDIRGVAISKGTLDVLMETGWVRLRGRRKAPGRPITYGTTDTFLLHFSLETIGDLPGLDELKAAGMFDGRLPEGFGVPQPRDGEALTEDEDPLEDGAIDLFDEQALVPGDGDEATGVTAEAEVELEALIDLDATGAPEAEPEAEAAEPEAENPEIPSETPKEV
jgi:segregation and condensation protein B